MPSADVKIQITSALAFFLREKREGSGLSALELASRLGVPPQDIFAIEKNSVSPPLWILKKISMQLGISFEELFQRIPSPEISRVRCLEQEELGARQVAFRSAAGRVASSAARAGVDVSAFENPSLPHFSALALNHQLQALRSLALKQEILTGWIAGGPFRSPKRLLWATLSGLGLVPPPQLFSHLNPNSILEIYNLDAFQVWRDLNMLCALSYNLEELHCLDGFGRFHRDPEHQSFARNAVADLLSVPKARLQLLELPTFTIKESMSKKRLTFRVKHELICSLANREGNLAGWLVMTAVEEGSWIKKIQELALNVRHEILCPLRDRGGEVMAWLLTTDVRVVGSTTAKTIPLLGIG